MNEMIEFKGKCKGIKLIKRGENDNHICFQILTEDDGDWFVDGTNLASCYWIDDLIEQLQRAKAYIQTQEPFIHDDKQYGYAFKEELPIEVLRLKYIGHQRKYFNKNSMHDIIAKTDQDEAILRGDYDREIRFLKDKL